MRRTPRRGSFAAKSTGWRRMHSTVRVSPRVTPGNGRRRSLLDATVGTAGPPKRGAWETLRIGHLTPQSNDERPHCVLPCGRPGNYDGGRNDRNGAEG